MEESPHVVFEELTSNLTKSALEKVVPNMFDAKKMDQLNLNEKDKTHQHMEVYIPDLDFIHSLDQLDPKVRITVDEKAGTTEISYGLLKSRGNI